MASNPTASRAARASTTIVSPGVVSTCAAVVSVDVRPSSNQRARSFSGSPTECSSGCVSSQPTPTTTAAMPTQEPTRVGAARRGGAGVSVASMRDSLLYQDHPVGSVRALSSAGSSRARPPPVAGQSAGQSALEQAAEHVLHDPAVAVVVRLARGVDPDLGVELRVTGRDLDRARCRAVVELGHAGDRELLLPGESQRLGGLALGVLQR